MQLLKTMTRPQTTIKELLVYIFNYFIYIVKFDTNIHD